MAVIASAGEQRDTLADALHVAESINSDGEKAKVLVHADAYWKDDDIVRRAYFRRRPQHSFRRRESPRVDLARRPQRP